MFSPGRRQCPTCPDVAAAESATSGPASPPDLPRNLYPGNDPSQPPENSWRSHASLLFQNWINEIYQTTPFQLEDIGG